MALQRQTLSIQIAQGLDTKTDEKQVPAGKALALENVRFQKTGKLSKRFGLVLQSTASTDGNFLTANKIALVSDSNSISSVTDKGVYTLSSVKNSWDNISQFKDFPKVASDFIYKSSLNHFNPDMDYNEELNLCGYVFREYQEGVALAGALEYVTVVIEDSQTGLKKTRKKLISPATTNVSLKYQKSQQKIMVVKNGTSARIIVFYEVNNFDGVVGSFVINKLVMDADLNIISEANIPYVFTSNRLLSTKFDVCRDSTSIFFALLDEFTLQMYKIAFDGSITTSRTKTVAFKLAVNTLSYPMGFSVCLSPNDFHVFWVALDGASRFVNCIAFTKTLTDSVPEDSVGNVGLWGDVSVTYNAGISLATSSVENFTTKRTVFYLTKLSFNSFGYTIESVSTQMNRVFHIGRPFVVNGSNFIIAKTVETDQRTGLIINIDQQKFVSSFSNFDLSLDREVVQSFSTSNICNSIASNGVIYCAVERIYGPYTSSTSATDFIANVGISRVKLDFNTDYTCGTKAKLGKTIYYTNGPTVSLDAKSAYESSFYLGPKIESVTQTTGTANPNVASKTFNYIAVYNYYNGKTELERSVPSSSVAITTNASASAVNILVKALTGSWKDDFDGVLVPNGTIRSLSEIILYRASAGTGGVYYRCANIPNSSLYLDVAQSITDTASDADLLNNERLYTTGGVLESDATPNAKFSTSGGNRLFLGGLEEQDEVAFSNKQIFGEAVSFNGFNRIRVSSGASADKTPISALGYMDAKLIIFRQQSIYFVQGDGPNLLGIGDFTEPEIISSDVGCTEPRSVVNTPNGLMFKSRKGIYLLSRNLVVEYIGAAVEEFNQYNVMAAIISDKFNEARFYLSNNDCLVYNFLFQSWSTFKNQTTVDADIWQGSPVVLNSSKVFKETENTYLDNGASGFYSMKFTSPWLKLDLVQGYVRCYQLWIIGDYKSSHTLKCRVYVDYDSSTYEDYSLVYNNSSSPQYQFQISLPNQKVESIKFEIYDEAQSGNGESYDLSNIQVEVGMKAGGYKLAANKSY